MKNFLLKLKSWQLFLLLYGLLLPFPFLYHYTAITIADLSLENPHKYLQFFIFILLPLITFISLGSWYNWSLGIVENLQKKLPQELQMNTKLFKVSIAIQIMYMVCLLLFALAILSPLIENLFVNNTIFRSFMRYVGMPAMPIALPACVYNLIYLSITISRLQFRKKTLLLNWLGIFILLLFFPLGIWVVQPIIRKILQHQ